MDSTFTHLKRLSNLNIIRVDGSVIKNEFIKVPMFRVHNFSSKIDKSQWIDNNKYNKISMNVVNDFKYICMNIL